MPIHKKFKKTGQQGVTLMLSILVLAAILSIAFSLATVTFVEIRSSGDLARTEPTYYAADAISEEALFTVKRNVSDTTYPYDNGIGTVSLTSNTSFISTAIFQATVPKTSYDFISTRSRFPIYDTQCLTPNSANMTNCPTGGSGYGRIKITYLDTGNTDHLKVFLCQFDPSKPINPSGTWPEVYTSTPCSNPYDTSNYYWLTPASGDDLTSGNTNNNVRETGTASWPSINPNLQQELIFYNSGLTGDIHVQIETFDSNGVAKGLPLVGSKAVDITASSQGVVRKIRTTIPITSVTGSNLNETVWVEDVVPPSATLGQDGGDSWNWVSSNPAQFSGSLAHKSNLRNGEHQHYFYSASGADTLSVNSTDRLFAYVYLDASNPPTQVMLQWNSNSAGWAHRAYWGANSICWSGCAESASNHYMGALPATGQWVKLEVTASEVGLSSDILNGMAFTLYDGRATWDKAGKTTP